MTNDEEENNKTGLARSQAVALSQVGTASLASRGMQDLLAREDAEQWYKRGLDLWNQESYEEAVGWFRRAADQGVADAQFFLGWIYQYWWHHSDYSIAAAWYFLAAEQGHAGAAFELGSLYEIGHGVRRDHAHAEAYYRQAADRGHERAQQALDDMLRK
jgi:TPR repeat protein